jgi:hypothetical protein
LTIARSSAFRAIVSLERCAQLGRAAVGIEYWQCGLGLATRLFLTQYNGTTLIVAHDAERVLADIDTNHSNCSVQYLGHGVLLVLTPLPQLLLLAGREHNRTISLTDMACTGCF